MAYLLRHAHAGSKHAWTGPDALRPLSKMPVTWAATGTLVEPGRVYVALPATHLVVNPDARLTVSNAPRIRFFRPSADWLFDSAAASFGDRHTAVVLSGMLSDGASKLRRVRSHGGKVLVQDPGTCPYPAMPTAAIATGHVDAVLPIDAMRPALLRIFSQREQQQDAAAWEDPFGAASLAS